MWITMENRPKCKSVGSGCQTTTLATATMLGIMADIHSGVSEIISQRFIRLADQICQYLDDWILSLIYVLQARFLFHKDITSREKESNKEVDCTVQLLSREAGFL